MHYKPISKSGDRIIEDPRLVDEYLAKELSRRQLVRGAMIGAVGTWLGASGLAACGPAGNRMDGGTDTGGGGDAGMPDAVTADTGPMRMPHLVGMGYHESDERAAIQAALDETIGLSMIRRGDSVYLRVNSNSGDPYPYSTSPELLLMVGGMLRDMGVTDLRIGDRSFWGDRNTANNLSNNGIAGAAMTLGTTAVAYEDVGTTWVTLPAGTVPDWVGTVRLPEPVTSATHIITLGCMKTHFIATFTMTLKISLGLVHPTDRARAGNLMVHDAIARRLGRQIAQISKAYTPSLVLIDGWQALITGGPTPTDRTMGRGGDTADPHVVIASTDRIAADVAGIAVLQTICPTTEPVTRGLPFANPQIAAAVTAGGLGITGADAFDLSGPTVPMVDMYRSRVTG